MFLCSDGSKKGRKNRNAKKKGERIIMQKNDLCEQNDKKIKDQEGSVFMFLGYLLLSILHRLAMLRL